MAALGRLSRVLLRSALTQSRRQLSAAVAGHGEQAGNSSALCFNPPGWRTFCSVYLDSNVFLLWQWPCCTSASRLALAANSSLSGQDVRAASQNTDFTRSVRQFDAVLSPHKTHYGYLRINWFTLRGVSLTGGVLRMEATVRPLERYWRIPFNFGHFSLVSPQK